jgi:hypothetical protein
MRLCTECGAHLPLFHFNLTLKLTLHAHLDAAAVYPLKPQYLRPHWDPEGHSRDQGLLSRFFPLEIYSAPFSRILGWSFYCLGVLNSLFLLLLIITLSHLIFQIRWADSVIIIRYNLVSPIFSFLFFVFLFHIGTC